VTEREHANQKLRWSLERLAYLHTLGSAASPQEVVAAWEEHMKACRRLSRISDGLSR
jgi:hypothetical protein